MQASARTRATPRSAGTLLTPLEPRAPLVLLGMGVSRRCETLLQGKNRLQPCNAGGIGLGSASPTRGKRRGSEHTTKAAETILGCGRTTTGQGGGRPGAPALVWWDTEGSRGSMGGSVGWCGAKLPSHCFIRSARRVYVPTLPPQVKGNAMKDWSVNKCSSLIFVMDRIAGEEQGSHGTKPRPWKYGGRSLHRVSEGDPQRPKQRLSLPFFPCVADLCRTSTDRLMRHYTDTEKRTSLIPNQWLR